MSGPFIFIATNRLKLGKLEAERERVPELCDFIEATEPRLIAFNEYASEDGREVGVVQVHPDAESMEFPRDVVSPGRDWRSAHRQATPFWRLHARRDRLERGACRTNAVGRTVALDDAVQAFAAEHPRYVLAGRELVWPAPAN